MAAQKAIYNKGHIAEYIFAIAIAAAFRKAHFAKKSTLENEYIELKDILQNSFYADPKQTVIKFGTRGKEKPTLKIDIHLGKQQPTTLSLASLKYFFETQDMKIKMLETTAIDYVYRFVEENPHLFETTGKKILIKSEGIVDQLQTKADITLKIDDKIKSFSLKTKSETVHATSWNEESATKMMQTLFYGPNSKTLEGKLGFRGATKTGKKEFFKEIVAIVAPGDGLVENKKSFIEGLRYLITKQTKEFEKFELVKLTDKGLFTSLLFSTDYEKIAPIFDYHVSVETQKAPKLKIQLKMPNMAKVASKFVNARPQGSAFLLEVGTAINLVANKYLKNFIFEFDSDKKLNQKAFVNPVYKQLVSTFISTGMMVEKTKKLTSKGEIFIEFIKSKFKSKY